MRFAAAGIWGSGPRTPGAGVTLTLGAHLKYPCQMGAWGHGSFDNDSALDWLGALAERDASFLGDTLDAVAGADDGNSPEVDESSAALAAAELVAAALGQGHERLSENAASWLKTHASTARRVGAERALRALQIVFHNSELRELWDENGSDTAWHADVRELIRRLGG